MDEIEKEQNSRKNNEEREKDKVIKPTKRYDSEETKNKKKEFYYAKEETRNIPINVKKNVETEKKEKFNGIDEIRINNRNKKKENIEQIEKEKLLILNKNVQEHEKKMQEQGKLTLNIFDKKEENQTQKENNNIHPNKNKNINDNNEESNNNNAKVEILVQRRKKTESQNKYDDSFFNKAKHSGYKPNEKIKYLFGISDLPDFPIILLEKRKEKEKKQAEKKYVVEFLDTFNDGFVRRNANNNVIFESIKICKGVSYFNVSNNINMHCMGWRESALYFYRMIPLKKIYSKEAIQKVMNERETNSIEKQDLTKTKDKKKKNEMTNNTLKNKNIFPDFFFRRLKNSLWGKNKNEKTKEKCYNDLYLMPYEKNLKSGICFGTHIYSKERAVKKCFGLSIEINALHGEYTNEENTNVQNNFENAYLDFPYNQNNVFFKPVFYNFKNKKIVDASFFKLLKNVNWDKWRQLTDKELYLNLKKDITNFAKDVCYTTKHTVSHYDSPTEFVSQTTEKMKNIKSRMQHIGERSYDIIRGLLREISKTSE